ncbi:hypothetical protein GL50803_0016910 [Giardia duodenalis]|uniref:Uncharacterized protein n=1 Tax=Giardia intestinalis (strain ATCC 50803 / WB clone C6) TaxID=184922 RepID=A8B9D9_GIAIC|nr:hypothetical protein GL50803_0016910 [Giardia intestinalis]KAE8306140.1 hypothetical protein GL50803_0016910 [Giardia intestinalis]|eukprot:XP_001708462.1 Hypothetical protein GL50803_16910 [Giardia lamblia ATCC 50803]
MLCSVCNSHFKPIDYCASSLASALPLPAMPDLTAVSLLCSACYERIRQALLLQKDRNARDAAIIEKQMARRKRMRALSGSLKAAAPSINIQSEIEEEEQKIKELEEQLKLQNPNKQIPTFTCLNDCHQLRVSRQGSMRPLFVFNEAASAVNGFSLLQVDPAHAEKLGDTLQATDAPSTALPVLRNRDGINAALAELTLCIQMLYQATFGDVYRSVFSRQGAISEPEGVRITRLYSILVAALPAPLVIVYHDGAPTSVLQAVSQQTLDPQLRGLRRAGRTVCELVWEKPTANAKLFTGADKDTFSLGLGALLGFVVDLYIFLGLECPCAITISRYLLNMHSNRQMLSEHYGLGLTVDKTETAGQRKPLLLNPLYVSSAVLDVQALRKLNIILTPEGDHRTASIDGAAPVHPAAGPEQWNSFVCKLVVVCNRVYGHIMELLRQ